MYKSITEHVQKVLDEFEAQTLKYTETCLSGCKIILNGKQVNN